MSKLQTKRTDIAKILRSYSMIFVLVAIVLLFQLLTGGLTLKPNSCEIWTFRFDPQTVFNYGSNLSGGVTFSFQVSSTPA